MFSLLLFLFLLFYFIFISIIVVVVVVIFIINIIIVLLSVRYFRAMVMYSSCFILFGCLELCWTMIQSCDYDWTSIFHVMDCMYSA